MDGSEAGSTLWGKEYYDCLLELCAGDAAAVDLHLARWWPPVFPQRQLCKYFFGDGRCVRRDCRYEHSMATCVYWKLGTCRADPPESCWQAHRILDAEALELQANQSSGSDAMELQITEHLLTEHQMMEPHLIGELRDPSRSQTFTGNQRFDSPSIGLNFAGAARATECSKRTVTTKNTKMVVPQQWRPQPSQREREEAAARSLVNGFSSLQGAERQWVTTGTAVAQTYMDARADAIAHAESRNRLFQASTAAYLRGDGKAAKDLSRQGRSHDERMQAAHAVAGAQIFALRNKNINPQNLPFEMIDLHGLHPREAVSALETALKRAQPARQPVYVITGTGHHSQAAKLLPAVLEFLDRARYIYADASTDGRMGMLCVEPKL